MIKKGLGYYNPIVSHRGFWHECKFWFRNTFGGSVPNNQLAYSKTPDGVFWAAENGDQLISEDSVASADFVSHNASIKTRDDVSMLRKKDLVSYDGKIWIVDGIRRHRVREFHQMCEGFDLFDYIISLSR